MPRDALRAVLMPDGSVAFPDAPRLPDGSIDWRKLGAEPRHYRVRDGRTHVIDARPTVPHPVTGEPIYPT